MQKTPLAADPHRDHAVQFYRDDASLMKTVSRFVREGLASGQPVVMIATPEHRAALAKALINDGLSPDHFEKSGTFWLLDARETLATFMNADGVPDPIRFRASVGGVIEQAQGFRDDFCVRAYGEMVDLLWKDGRADAAIRLEVLWNALAASYRFSLLCGYAIGNFYKEQAGFDIGDVCHVHTKVLPA